MEQKIRHELTKMYGIIAVLLGLGIYAHQFVYDGIMAKAALNLSIFALFGLAAAIAFRHVLTLKNEVVALKALQVDFGDRRRRPINPYSTPAVVFHEPELLGQGYRMITEELGKQDDLHISSATVQTLLHDVDQRINDRRSTIMYFSGLMVFLGLLGAFMGLMKTVHSVGDLIGGMDISGTAGADSFGKMIEGMKAPLNGMSVGFSSSLFGLMTSMVLGALERCMTSAMKTLRNEYEHWLSNQAALEGSAQEAQAQAAVDFTPLRRTLEMGVHQLKQMREHLSDTGKADQQIHQSLDAVGGAVERLAHNVEALSDPKAMLAPITEAVADLARNQTVMLTHFKGLYDEAEADRRQMRLMLDDMRAAADRQPAIDVHALGQQVDRLLATRADARAEVPPVDRSEYRAGILPRLFALPGAWRHAREARALRREMRRGLHDQQRALNRMDNHLDERLEAIETGRREDREILFALARLGADQQDRLVGLAERLLLSEAPAAHDRDGAMRDARGEMEMLARRLDARIDRRAAPRDVAPDTRRTAEQR